MVYRALQAVNPQASRAAHDTRRLKLWSVSPLVRDENRLYRMRLSSPDPQTALGLLSALTQLELQVGELTLKTRACYPIDPPPLKERTLWVLWGTGGILTAHRDFSDPARVKKWYVRPNDSRGQDIDALLKKNLESKAVALGLQADVSCIKVKAVETGRKPVMTKVKGNWVIAWRGCVAVEASVRIQRMIWECGLGQQNALGYGKVVPAVSA
jgi:CRISPR-associated endoribonuclease Cas6